MGSDRTTIPVDKETRSRIRRYKAQDGLSYAEAINELLDEVKWETDDE